MSQESVPPINPAPGEFVGDSSARSAKRLFHATRPKFFPASVLPVVVGTAWGAYVAGAFDAYVFMLALVATVCVHAASNVLNDVGDEMIGTDRINEQRIYPYTGGSRFIQMGILSQSIMARLGAGLLVFAAILGVLLFLEKGPAILLFGLAGIALGVLYSLGPVKLSSLGIGEIAVAVAFGVLPVTGAAWLQGASIDTALVLYSLPVSAWVFAILFINEVPDIKADGATGKNTLPVRLGLQGEVTSLAEIGESLDPETAADLVSRAATSPRKPGLKGEANQRPPRTAFADGRDPRDMFDQCDSSRGRSQRTGEHAKEGCFACPVVSDHSDEFAAPKLDVDASNDGLAAVPGDRTTPSQLHGGSRAHGVFPSEGMLAAGMAMVPRGLSTSMRSVFK